MVARIGVDTAENELKNKMRPNLGTLRPADGALDCLTLRAARPAQVVLGQVFAPVSRTQNLWWLVLYAVFTLLPVPDGKWTKAIADICFC